MGQQHSMTKVTISWGMFNVPVSVHKAAGAENISFNMIHTCGSRINQKTHCPKCNKDIERSDTVKGYPNGKDKYLTFTADELKQCAPKSEKVIEILQTVDGSQIDPLLFESSYYLAADTGGQKGYALFVEGLRSTGKVAVGKATLSQREHIVIIRPTPKGVGLMFHTMYYQTEVREAHTVSDVAVKPAELALMKQLIEASEEPFEHAAFRDEYQHNVSELIFAKQQGQVIEMPAPTPTPSVAPDIMEALAASLKAPRKKKATPIRHKEVAA